MNYIRLALVILLVLSFLSYSCLLKSNEESGKSNQELKANKEKTKSKVENTNSEQNQGDISFGNFIVKDYSIFNGNQEFLISADYKEFKFNAVTINKIEGEFIYFRYKGNNYRFRFSSLRNILQFDVQEYYKMKVDMSSELKVKNFLSSSEYIKKKNELKELRARILKTPIFSYTLFSCENKYSIKNQWFQFFAITYTEFNNGQFRQYEDYGFTIRDKGRNLNVYGDKTNFIFHPKDEQEALEIEEGCNENHILCVTYLTFDDDLKIDDSDLYSYRKSKGQKSLNSVTETLDFYMKLRGDHYQTLEEMGNQQTKYVIDPSNGRKIYLDKISQEYEKDIEEKRKIIDKLNSLNLRCERILIDNRPKGILYKGKLLVYEDDNK